MQKANQGLIEPVQYDTTNQPLNVRKSIIWVSHMANQVGNVIADIRRYGMSQGKLACGWIGLARSNIANGKYLDVLGTRSHPRTVGHIAEDWPFAIRHEALDLRLMSCKGG